MTTRTARALAHSLPAPTDAAAPARIVLMTIGETKGADGRGPYRIRDAAAAQEIIAASMNGAGLPIDYDHATDLAAPHGLPAPAAAWIKALHVEGNDIVAEVEWTDRGGKAVAGREYRFISPTFMHDDQGNVLRFLRAALTNNPNFNLPALASQTEEVDLTPEQQKALRAALGLPETADLTVAIAAASTATAAVKALASIGTKLGLKADATAADIETALAAALTKQQTDAAQIASLTGQIVALNSQITESKAAAEKKEAEAKVDAAIKEGRLVPALRDTFLSLAASNPTAFKETLEKLPAVMPAGSAAPGGAPPAGGAAVDNVDVALCAQLGISVEDYKKTLGVEKGA